MWVKHANFSLNTDNFNIFVMSIKSPIPHPARSICRYCIEELGLKADVKIPLNLCERHYLAVYAANDLKVDLDKLVRAKALGWFAKDLLADK